MSMTIRTRRKLLIYCIVVTNILILVPPWSRFHNPKVGSSILPPATKFIKDRFRPVFFFFQRMGIDFFRERS